MITIDSKALNKTPMRLRHAVRDGHAVALTFRSAVYAAVVPWEQRQAELHELAALRERVAELEKMSDSVKEAAA